LRVKHLSAFCERRRCCHFRLPMPSDIVPAAHRCSLAAAPHHLCLPRMMQA